MRLGLKGHGEQAVFRPNLRFLRQIAPSQVEIAPIQAGFASKAASPSQGLRQIAPFQVGIAPIQAGVALKLAKPNLC